MRKWIREGEFEDLLHWGAMGGDEISGGGSGVSEMTEALEFKDPSFASRTNERRRTLQQRWKDGV